MSMSRVRDKLIQLKKEYASYDEHDGIYAEEVQEMIDELLDDLRKDTQEALIKKAEVIGWIARREKDGYGTTLGELVDKIFYN
jgi:hypothetical protein